MINAALDVKVVWDPFHISWRPWMIRPWGWLA